MFPQEILKAEKGRLRGEFFSTHSIYLCMKTFADVLEKGHTSRFERSLPDLFTNQLDMVLARRRFVEVEIFADIGIECPFFFLDCRI